MKRVREELDRLITERNVSYAAISRLLDRNSSYVQQFIKRGSPRHLDSEDITKLAKFFGVREQVFGGMPEVTESMVQIPILDLEASAGFGAIASGENAYMRFGFHERWLRKLTAAKPDSLSIIHVAGDSMEPTLSAGDEVLVDASDIGRRLRDGIYVIRNDDDIIVKRIAVTPGSRMITIASDNPAYPTWSNVDPAKVYFVGRVIWLGRSI